MKLQFSIEYYTHWGENIGVVLTTVDIKGREKSQLYMLETQDGHTWRGETRISENTVKAFYYHYGVYAGERLLRAEWNVVPRYFKADATKNFIFPDSWRDVPLASYLYTSAFTKCVYPREIHTENLSYFSGTLMLRVDAPQLKDGQALAILGNQPALGDWNPDFAFMMKEVALHEWCVTLSTVGLTFPMEYKYVIVDANTGAFVDWEGGDNRVLPANSVTKDDVLVISDAPLRVQENKWKGAGVVIPVFSLRSEGSCGVGDFGDLKRLTDWVALTGMRVIQVLPVYDTTIHRSWLDSYPYNSISIYALHPQYMDLRQLPRVADEMFCEEYERCREALNALPEVDYEKVYALKEQYIRRVYLQEKEACFASQTFRDFYRQNEEWLMPYAAFSVLRDRYGTADFNTWPEYSEFKVEEVYAFCKTSGQAGESVGYYYFMQYHLHCQLLSACEYARSKGIILKGDIPIGISRHSVEAWVEPFYFNLNAQAGAPPDAFSVNGQNWGFPTYNWDAMQKDQCRWWVRRFKKMAEYFDAYRIDHVLGFFRIWEIPEDAVHGLLGQFSPALPMTVEEIESYGLRFRKNFFTRPNISDWVLEEYFGERAEEIKEKYLQPKGYDWYEMKPEYDTQKKIKQAFEHCTSPEDVTMREGLYSLISNVLFVPDREDPEKYHPRISAQLDCLYQMLSGAERDAFNALYNDYFYRRHNEFWYAQAMQKLPVLIDATRMLVCAEDLGMVPDCVPWVMNDLRILSLEIQTMPKQSGIRFSALENNPYRSVATIFTHDMPTLRGWWEEDYEQTNAYYHEVLQKDGDAPAVMPGWLCEEVVARHLYSPSMLCLISWQDWLSIDETLRRPDVASERINVPANPRNYWHYRMHLTLEQLMASDGLNEKIKLLIEHSERDR